MRNVQPLGDGDDMLESPLKIGQVLDGLGHGKVVQLVRQHDRPPRIIRPVLRGVQDGLVVGVDLGGGHGGSTGVDAPVVRVDLPQDRCEVQGLSDDSDSVVDVAKGRSEVDGGDAGDELDRLLGVVQLGKDLFVGHGRQVSSDRVLDDDQRNACAEGSVGGTLTDGTKCVRRADARPSTHAEPAWASS